MQTKLRKSQVTFGYAIQSFVGYLEGTQKAAHTIKSYRLDLLAFQDFIAKEYSDKLMRLDQIECRDLDLFREYLKEQGLKTNTRRRKILTVTQFLNYLTKRKKLSSEMAKKIPAPHKVERIPFTVSSSHLIAAIQGLSAETIIEARNQALLWTLAETGCLVSEIPFIRFENWNQISPSHAALWVGVKASRQVPVSLALFQAIQNLKNPARKADWVFFGFNKFGSLGSPISSRGIELLVKLYGARLGFVTLTPRTFRHSIIINWFENGIPQTEIQARLGLKTAYAFRSYETLISARTL